jgi:hypothetical protein
LYLVGSIDYFDELGTFRRTGFLRRYRKGTDAFVDRFIPIRDPDYEYAD